MPNVPHLAGYRFGIAKQSAEGTPATVVDALWQVWGGEFKATQTFEQTAVADINAMRPATFKKTAGWTGSLTLGVFAETIGAVIKYLLGSDSITGAGPYQHRMGIADPNNNWLSFWQLRTDGTGPGSGL